MFAINEYIGEFGTYHIWLCFVILISRFGVGLHQTAIVFLAPSVQYHCPDLITNCCVEPVYDTTVFKKTIITEWHLICEYSWLKDFHETIYQFGVLAGNLLLGIASDRYGRKSTLLISVIIEIFAGVMSSFMPEYWSFTITRMILGFSVGGVMVISFVIIVEYIGLTKRDIVSVLFHASFSVGHMLLPVFSYYIRDYSYLQLSISVSNVILFVYICVLPESPRWLLAVNRKEEAVLLTEEIAKINNIPTEVIRYKIEEYQFKHRLAEPKNLVILDLFLIPKLRSKILIMMFIWHACSCSFYSMTYYSRHISDNVFVNEAAIGGVSLCGCAIALPLIKFYNRKTVIISMNSLCSLCIFITAFVCENNMSVVLGSVGVMCCYVIFVAIYIFCAEMFPTVVRNTALGFFSMAAQFAAMFAPLVANIHAPVVSGVFCIMAAFLCLLLPETKNCELLMTVEDCVNFTKNPHPTIRKDIGMTTKQISLTVTCGS